jgi:hypothetical protein
MEHLITIATSEDVQRIAAAALEYSETQGVAIATDPSWLLLARLRPILGEQRTALVAERLADFLRYWRDYSPYPGGLTIDDLWLQFQAPPWFGPGPTRPTSFILPELSGPIDRSWTPPGWPLDLPDSLGGTQYVITVSLLPGTAAVTDSLRSRLQEMALGANLSLRVEFEIRPVALLFSRPATALSVQGGTTVWCNGTATGTAGGVVKDISGAPLIVTAAHVVQPLGAPVGIDVPAAGGSATANASCSWASTLHPVTSPFTLSAAQACPDVDVALLAASQPISTVCDLAGIGVINGCQPITKLGEGDIIEMAGKASGYRRLRIGSFVLAQRFALGGAWYGYRDLMQLRRLSRMWGLTGSLRRPARPGDSGAWIVHPGATGPMWAGSVIGGDRPVGYACFAERVVSACAAAGQVVGF